MYYNFIKVVNGLKNLRKVEFFTDIKRRIFFFHFAEFANKFFFFFNLGDTRFYICIVLVSTLGLAPYDSIWHSSIQMFKISAIYSA